MKKLLTALFFLCAFTANAGNPTLKIKQFDGKIFDLSKQKGKITIVTFWAQWCHNCKRDMPILDQVYKEYKSRGVEVIAISIDGNHQRQKAKKLAQKFSYPAALKSDAIISSFSQPKFIPTYYVIGKNGEFLKTIFNDKNLNKRDLRRILDRYL